MKIVIIGAGASALSCAINSKNNTNEVIVLEHNDKPLKKLLLTGNGKCNYFNDEINENKYFSYDKNLIKELINEENINKLKSFYDEIGLIPRIKNGYYYPASSQAYTVFNSLMKEAQNKGVEFIYNYEVKSIQKQNNKFIINDDIECDKLVISTGSYAYYKTGSVGDGYNFAKNFNIKINRVFPSLVGLLTTNKLIKDVSGVRSEVKTTLYRNNEILDTECGEIQFTDFGLSGICIFNLSTQMKDDNYTVGVNFLNDFNITKKNFNDELTSRSNKLQNRTITEILEFYLNYKIVNAILKISKIDTNKNYNELNQNEKNTLMNNLLDYRFDITGTKSYDFSQVCSGGISLNELNLKDLSCKKEPNLYFTGEIIDITGKCGGYNLSFAFLSGILVGEHIND